jgi:3-hydroxyisobutyrate dehydrogenase-like beta-hydroxyacid dehydrogenase
MKVGFIGLGRMGTAIAGSLLRAGHEVTVYNRTPSKAHSPLDCGLLTGAITRERIVGLHAQVRNLEDLNQSKAG